MEVATAMTRSRVQRRSDTPNFVRRTASSAKRSALRLALAIGLLIAFQIGLLIGLLIGLEIVLRIRLSDAELAVSARRALGVYAYSLGI